MTRRKSPLSCLVDECGRPISARGLCDGHYRRLRAGTSLDDMPRLARKPQVPRGTRPQLCTVQGCTNRCHGRGLCNTHLIRARAGKELTSPIRRIRPRRSGSVTAEGYMSVYVAGNRTRRLEHRVVMEQVLGRFLMPDEYVHHKNGNRLDNRPENLELWVTSQPPGQRPADLVAWAKEILARYDQPGAGDQLT